MKHEPIPFCSKLRKHELRNDKSYVHIMKYMGSKRELLPDIRRSIKDIVPTGGTVLDLFAGTASVGAYLKKDYNIISNDIQNYSHVLSKALIGSSSVLLPDNFDHILDIFEKEYINNKEKIKSIFPKTYNRSNMFVNIQKGTWTEKLKNEYQIFFDTFPSASNKFNTNSKELQLLADMYLDSSKNKKNIYFQTTFLFSETYFSFEQALDIDSIRYAIDKTIKDEVFKNIFLAALMHAYSYCSSGTGHFAMFRNLIDLNSVEDTFLYRRKSVWKYFISKLNELMTYHQYIPNKKYYSYSEDYKDLLDNDLMENVDLIYADPPYSPVHYSRFYHAIESLVKYDYDMPKFKGRLRSDRHQSPFCQKTNVKEAFEILFKRARKHDANVLLSYSDTGMISQKEIKQIIIDNNYKYDCKSIIYNHSTLGRKSHKSNTISEYLIQATI